MDMESNRIVKKSLKLNFIMNAILTMSSFLFPIITFPYVSRILLPMGTGKVSFSSSLVAYFSMFAQLGIPTYGIRVCAKVRDNRNELTKTVHELFIINLIMSALVYTVFGAMLVLVPRMAEERLLLLVVSPTILFNTIGMEWLYKALEQYSYITIRSLVFKVIAVIAMFALIHDASDYVLYGGISIFAGSASNIFNFINAHKYIDMKYMGHYQLKKHTKAIFIFFAMSCATTIYTNLDTVMLGFMKTDMDVGYYNAAIKIKVILTSIVTSLGTVLLPRASYYIEHNMHDDFIRVTNKAINFVFLTAPAMGLYFILFAPEVIYFLSGTGYSGSIIPMQIMMPTIFLIGLSNIMGIQMLVPMGHEKIVLYSEIFGAIVNVMINAILIPHFAAAGAAVGTLIAEFVVAFVQFIMLRKIVILAYKSIRYILLGIALVLSAVVSVYVKYLNINVFITLVFSSILFFGIYLVVLTIGKENLIVEVEHQFWDKVKK